ncbi:MAG: hypothetical protein M1837_006318 [Sclerophora amabilis]|nr:MAG: hypothetical protein M1837_006318 [Sclerophora amabilis]
MAENEDHQLWLYTPSKALAIVFFILYFFTTTAHLLQLYRYRTFFLIPLVIAATWETAGYMIRIVSASNHLEDISLYSTSLSLIVLAPALVAAFDYMLLGRMLIRFVPEKKALRLPARKITYIFVTCDVFSFMVQLGGTGTLASVTENPELGKIAGYIVIAGLGIQLLAFGIFTVAAIRFHVKMQALERRDVATTMNADRSWVPLIWCLYGSCFCIILRKYKPSPSTKDRHLNQFQNHASDLISIITGSVYRLAEFSQGFEGYLASHEVFFYTLEALPMLPPFMLFNIWHPGRVLLKARGEQNPA